MLAEEANRDVFRRAAVGADAVVVEGMMGLFDGKDGITETGSSAEIAKLLKLPVHPGPGLCQKCTQRGGGGAWL